MDDPYQQYLTGEYIPLYDGKRVFVDDGPFSGVGWITRFDDYTADVSMAPRGVNKMYGRSKLREPLPGQD